MPRILVKGGIWKNTEDEILKVAVMKYGKNQWSRIASLLHKKTAKQCKTRWYEWLDPHIKKTEWSRDEDEKLLHLAKLMPTQWRTIAPIVGRTAAQCLERYEYLLDKVQEAADDVETADVVSDPRKLKPGEIDPNPESKPAKPDAIDMDEDELEMLSEARARLANTQGKKAKRKARERQLDEARRLSSMQKRRELLAAGIQGFRTLGRRKLRTFIDYTKEVPFERKAPQGFFDADEDQFNKKDPDFVAFQKNLQKELNDKNEHLLRKKDKDKQKRKLESDPELALLQMHGGGNAANVDIFTKRAKLNLPEPQVNDDELGQVVKIGMETQYARDSITGANSNTFDTGDLLADYSTTPATSSRDLSQLGSSKLRTPSTISRETNILNEARNIIALNNVQTPLVGGENTELDVGKMDFAGVTPKVAPIQTPNTVLRQTVTTQTNQTIGATPSVLMGESVRDKMGINSMRGSVNQRQEDSIDEDRTNHDLNADITTPSTMMSNYNGSMKLEKKLQRMQLRTMLDMLPKPEDDFEIVIPEKNEKLMSSNDYDDVDMEIQKDGMLFSSENKNAPSVLTVIDAADLDAEKQQLLEIERKKRLSMLSTVVQKGFPHPLNLPANSKSNESEMSTVEQLIQQEMGNMVKNVLTDYLDLIVDSSLKPLTLTQKKFRTKIVNDLGFKSNKVPSSSDVSYDDIEKAKELVKDEYEEFLKDCLFDHDFPQFSEYIDEINNSIMLSNSATKDSQLDVTNLKQELDYLKSIMHKYSQKVAKNQTKLEILVGGYQRNINNYSSKYAKLLNEYSSLHENREMFGRLLSTENKILENRLTEWKNKLLQQKQLQHFLQQRYLELTSMANNLNN